MERKNLKLFTRISLFTALAVIIIIPTYIFMSLIISNESAAIIRVISLLASLTIIASVFGIPLSIVSMFSKENLAVRIFASIINLLPGSILGYGIFMEFIDEFLRGPP